MPEGPLTVAEGLLVGDMTKKPQPQNYFLLVGYCLAASHSKHQKHDYVRFSHLKLHQMKKSDIRSEKTGMVSTRNDIAST